MPRDYNIASHFNSVQTSDHMAEIMENAPQRVFLQIGSTTLINHLIVNCADAPRTLAIIRVIVDLLSPSDRTFFMRSSPDLPWVGKTPEQKEALAGWNSMVAEYKEAEFSSQQPDLRVFEKKLRDCLKSSIRHSKQKGALTFSIGDAAAYREGMDDCRTLSDFVNFAMQPGAGVARLAILVELLKQYDIDLTRFLESTTRATLVHVACLRSNVEAMVFLAQCKKSLLMHENGDRVLPMGHAVTDASIDPKMIERVFTLLIELNIKCFDVVPVLAKYACSHENYELLLDVMGVIATAVSDSMHHKGLSDPREEIDPFIEAIAELFIERHMWPNLCRLLGNCSGRVFDQILFKLIKDDQRVAVSSLFEKNNQQCVQALRTGVHTWPHGLLQRIGGQANCDQIVAVATFDFWLELIKQHHPLYERHALIQMTNLHYSSGYSEDAYFLLLRKIQESGCDLNELKPNDYDRNSRARGDAGFPLLLPCLVRPAVSRREPMIVGQNAWLRLELDAHGGKVFNIDGFVRLISRFKLDVNTQNDKGYALLHYLCHFYNSALRQGFNNIADQIILIIQRLDREFGFCREVASESGLEIADIVGTNDRLCSVLNMTPLPARNPDEMGMTETQFYDIAYRHEERLPLKASIQGPGSHEMVGASAAAASGCASASTASTANSGLWKQSGGASSAAEGDDSLLPCSQGL